ncbi:ergothioneine biosynthesis protein EgtC [Streptomyces klenkii]|uniref:Ergothioneine biosynthesis protein EgtC n=1 Tax=Streptomyces klenkii TaxID=1420899 RepID=A0A3A9ZYZ3_9ACTN|nr:ergothioneine biosynthesis protein EgtC [Streptomyces klenkii]RKN53513.1 ergothioneine biosynthesis protein EgtC [Streptomyces klenkii]
MCRHLAYLGPVRSLAELLTEPPHSLYRQSWTPTLNADGFGVGWYPPGDGAGPVRYRRSVPIWADANLPALASVLRSGAVLAAVRSATPGTSLDESAAAPYTLGRWLFSHNGRVEHWRSLPEDLGVPLTAAQVLGMEAHTDSALLWLLAGRRLAAGEPPGYALAGVVRAITAARPTALLNLLLTDGHAIAATRHGHPLHYRRDAEAGSVTVASEPCTDDPGWQERTEARREGKE